MNLLKLVVSFSVFLFDRKKTNFISEEAIILDTQQTEKAIADLSASIIVDSTSNIIRRANRILLVTYQEIENSEDSNFTTQLQQVSNTLKESNYIFLLIEKKILFCKKLFHR
jgi:hypothetical protein